jgi:hypothetical protein
MWSEQLHVASFDDAWDPAAPYETTGFCGARTLRPGQTMGALPPSLNPLSFEHIGNRFIGTTTNSGAY